MPVQITGEIGPFLDTVQQRQVSVVVDATCDYTSNGPVADPAQLAQHVQAQMMRAIRDVIAPKMATGQLEFRHLIEAEVDGIIPEIIAVSGVAQNGIRVDNLAMKFGIDGREPHVWRQPKKPQQPQAPQIHAQVRVGGFNINASSSGGVDAAGLKNQLIGKAKSQLLFWAIGVGLVLLVVISLGAYGLYVWKSESNGVPSAGGAAKWDGKTPLVCAGNNAMTVTGVTANIAATAITAIGSCTLTLVNVDITGATAIEAGGAATVTVQGGKINGSAFAVHAGGGAKVTLSGTKVTGKTQAIGGAKITGP
jgi:hypothetical protein